MPAIPGIDKGWITSRHCWRHRRWGGGRPGLHLQPLKGYDVSMTEEATPWQRLTGRGMYPVEYAAWLLNPVRNLIAPAWLVVNRLGLKSTDHVLEIGCGPGFFSPAAAKRLSAGRLVLFDAQDRMIQIASSRLTRRGLTNFESVTGSAEALPFAADAFDVVFMVTVLGEVPDRAAAVREAARVLRPGGRFSTTEAAGDPDVVKRSEIRALAAQAGLEPERVWEIGLISTHNFRKPMPVV